MTHSRSSAWLALSISVHILLSKRYVGAGQKSAHRPRVDGQDGGYFEETAPFTSQYQQRGLFGLERCQDLPHANLPLEFAEGILRTLHGSRPRRLGFIARAPLALLEVVERQPERGAIQPAHQIAIRRRWVAMQSPERFRGQFLRPADVADDPVNQPRQRAIVGGKEFVEIAGAFEVLAHIRSIRTGTHSV